MRRPLKIERSGREHRRARGLVQCVALLRRDRYRGGDGSGCTAIGDLDPPRAGVRRLATTGGAAVRLCDAGDGRLDHAQEARQKHQRNGEATNHRGSCRSSFGQQFADKFPYPALGVNSAMRWASQPDTFSRSTACDCRDRISTQLCDGQALPRFRAARSADGYRSGDAASQPAEPARNPPEPAGCDKCGHE
jgi:hypothetical protein